MKPDAMRRHFETIDSTNEAAKQWACDANTPAPHGAVVTADEQTNGRGRRGRDWVSTQGKGIYLSVLWRPEIAVTQIGQLTIVVALAAARCIEEISSLRAQTKWPNDVLVNGKKIGGILCEAEIKNGRIEFVIAGVGLNINFDSDQLPPRPIFPATSLLLETGRTTEISLAREMLVKQLQQEYSRYADGQWNTQRGEFIERCVTLGKRVGVRNEGEEYSGVAVGVDKDGLLIVQTENGLREVVAGDVFELTTDH
jgi:BirA family biotin operon repressor/biotin-[acetyl-CoA-carboxylase] ligase